MKLKVILKFDTINSKFSHRLPKVWYLAAKNYYNTFFPELKRSLAKIANLSFSVLFII